MCDPHIGVIFPLPKHMYLTLRVVVKLQSRMYSSANVPRPPLGNTVRGNFSIMTMGFALICRSYNTTWFLVNDARCPGTRGALIDRK